jgi:RHS repeat-associated protein
MRILAGMYADQETGLYYNWFRYYDPKTGRGIQPDRMSVAEHVARWQAGMGMPGQPPLEINPYAYVANNPLRWVDPFGQAIVYIWRPGRFVGKNGIVYESPYGHATVMTVSGLYLSHHPKKSGANQLSSLFRTYEQDRELYGRDADFIAYISLPDEAAASRFAQNYMKSEKFWGPYGNCVDATSSTLNAGGLGFRDLSSGLFDFVSYPLELERGIQGIYWRNKAILRDQP